MGKNDNANCRAELIIDHHRRVAVWPSAGKRRSHQSRRPLASHSCGRTPPATPAYQPRKAGAAAIGHILRSTTLATALRFADLACLAQRRVGD